MRRKKIEKILKKKIEVLTLLKYLSTIIAILIMVFLYKKGIVAPLFINGEPITFSEIVNVVFKDGDTNFLEELIAEKIVLFEAKKRNIVVQKEEVETEIYRIEKEALESGITLIQLLKERDTTLEELEKNTKIRLTLYKILSEDIEVTENEIDEYIRQNQDIFKQGEEQVIREEVKRILLERKVSEVYKTWIRDARAATEVRYIINY